jgi:DNA uptake protein ComE-like DNA-binding protein
MNFLRKWIRNLLGFSARETNGFIILLPIILAIVFTEPIYRTWVSHRTNVYSVDQRKLDSLVALWDMDTKILKEESTNPTRTKPKPKRFQFNPNTATVEELMLLGFPEKIARRVVTYRQKGGKFNTPTDLSNIYGIDSILYNSLKSYVVIPNHRNGQPTKQPEKPTVQRQKARMDAFDINEADTAALKSVYGIGIKLAERIVKFRMGLGGFVSLNQLSEIYGLDSVVVNRLKKRSFLRDDFSPKKININTATEFEMSTHPYIRRTIAKVLVAWRFQHGQFTSVDQIENLNILKSEDIVKIVPYLKVEE